MKCNKCLMPIAESGLDRCFCDGDAGDLSAFKFGPIRRVTDWTPPAIEMLAVQPMTFRPSKFLMNFVYAPEKVSFDEISPAPQVPAVPVGWVCVNGEPNRFANLPKGNVSIPDGNI